MLTIARILVFIKSFSLMFVVWAGTDKALEGLVMLLKDLDMGPPICRTSGGSVACSWGKSGGGDRLSRVFAIPRDYFFVGENFFFFVAPDCLG